MKKFISTFLVSWVIWIILAGISINEIILGGVASLIIASIISKHTKYSLDILLPIKLVKFIGLYVPLFVYKLVISNFDMAYRVLSPSLPINPGFVKIPTNIKNSIGKLTLANSITLTPGTLTVDVKDQFLYIHWVNVQGKNNEDYQKHISSGLEKVLGGIFSDKHNDIHSDWI